MGIFNRRNEDEASPNQSARERADEGQNAEADEYGLPQGPGAEEQNPEDLAAAEDQEGSEEDGKSSRPKTPWRKSQEEDEKEEKELRESLGSGFKEAREADEAEDTGFYKGDDDQKGTGLARRARSRFGKLRKNRWALAGLGGGLIGLIIAGSALFNFLNLFKLEHLLDNIDAKSFARINATFERRSDKWMKAYLTVRLAEFNGTLSRNDNDNLWIKANKVDTNRPFTDWFRTMRTNGFEEKILNKKGIFFSSTMTPDGNVAQAVIKVGDQERLFNITAGSGKKFTQLNPIELNNIVKQIDHEVLQIFDGPETNKSMRRTIRKVVKDETYFFQVLRRRHVRKHIQNKLGVSDWKFFEKTRNKVTAKKSEIQKKMLRKILPNDTKSGKFLLCVFGAGPCIQNTDLNNPDARSGRAPTGPTTEDEGDKPVTDDQGHVEVNEDDELIRSKVGANNEAGAVVEEFGEAVDKRLTEGAVDGLTDNAANAVVRAELLKSIMTKVNVVTAVISIVRTMDQISRIDKNIVSGYLAHIAVISKSAQAAQAYTTYAIMRDQIKSGELTSEEFGVIMEGLKGAENSEAYDYFFNQSPGTVSALTSKAEFCKPTHVPKPGEYYFNCDQTKVGGVNNGDKIQATYMNSIGATVHPLAVEYRKVRDAPGIKQLFDFANWITDQLGSLISSLVEPALRFLGLDDDIERAMVWITERVMTFLGAAPILTGVNDAAGLTLTMIGQGSEVVAEGTTREAGAPASNPASKAFIDNLTLAYMYEQKQDQGLYERYIAINNPDSFAARSLYNLSNVNLEKIGSIGDWLGNGFRNIGSIFTPRAKAQSVGNNFADIDTYDFPPECLNIDPLEVRFATQMTNAADLFNDKGEPFIDSEDITIDLLENVDSFWAKVYERVGDSDHDNSEVQKIYNCETLDQKVRGSLGFMSGYTADGGLESGQVFIPGSGTHPPGTEIDCNTVTGNEKVICAGQNFTGVRYANRNEGTGTKWLNEWGVSQITGNLGQIPKQWIAERVVGSDNDFFDCSGFAKTAIYAAYGVTVNAACSGGFLTDAQYFKPIDYSEKRAGDFLVESTTCGNGGHVGIFVGITPSGKERTLESSAGKNINNEKKSGFYERTAGVVYKYAVRYIGPGSSP